MINVILIHNTITGYGYGLRHPQHIQTGAPANTGLRPLDHMASSWQKEQHSILIVRLGNKAIFTCFIRCCMIWSSKYREAEHTYGLAYRHTLTELAYKLTNPLYIKCRITRRKLIVKFPWFEALLELPKCWAFWGESPNLRKLSLSLHPRKFFTGWGQFKATLIFMS